MALSRKKYRRVPDLYVTGKEVVLLDGTVLWLQVLNPFEKDECAHDAQIARARIVMAVKDGDERKKVEGAFYQDGRDVTIDKIADAKATEHVGKIVDEIAGEEEWKEKIEIMDRSDDILASNDPAERDLLTRLNEEYLREVVERQKTEFDYQVDRLTSMTDEDLLDEYIEMWLERRGTDVARLEYQLTEIWYAARVCEGVDRGDGTWDHEACEGHKLTVWETKQEVRGLGGDLQELLTNQLAQLNMSARDARFSDRQGSSSDSPPLPSEAAESTPSTQTEILVGAPGTSP